MFSNFILPDDMIHQETLDRFKEKDLKKSFGFVQGLSNLGSEKFVNLSQNQELIQQVRIQENLMMLLLW